MRTPNNKKRLLAAGIVTVILLGGAGAAYAYWSVTGAGTGTAATGTGLDNIVINDTSSTSGIAPGSGQHTLSGNFDNLNDEAVYVSTVSVSISSISGAGVGGCEADDYLISGSPMTVNANVPVGEGVGSWTGATIEFVNEAAEDQNGCKGATVNLAYTSN
jgi:hypothetical protein